MRNNLLAMNGPRTYSPLVIAICFVILLATSCQESAPVENLKYILESTVPEQLMDNKETLLLPDGKKVMVNLGGIQTEDDFHSAPKSILLTGKSQYSFGTTLDSLTVNDFYVISIWRKDPSRKSGLLVQSEPKNIVYQGANVIAQKGENGWEQIQLTLEVPPGVEQLKLYTLLGGADSAYFDDLRIECYRKKTYPNYQDTSRLHLYFSAEQIQNFEEERKIAFLEGVHFSNDKWEKAVLSDEQKVFPIKARLKGDWLDHLQGKKWSFRVKMRKDNAFKRMKSFSLQTPESRYFLHEFIAHKLLAQEDILTTRYSFSPVNINRENVGLYAIEEHFAKQLVEYNKRREGPIIKFDEDPLWNNAAFDHGVNKLTEPHPMPHYDVSRVMPFGSGKIIESPHLLEQFKIAHALALKFKYARYSADEIFDIDKMAKYLALIDVINGKHGLAWHNQRYYYNPVICKLEPINFDNFVDNFSSNAKSSPGAIFMEQNKKLLQEKRLMPFLFSSEKLLSKYIMYLEKYSTDEFIRTSYQNIRAEVEKNLSLIQEEFPNYHVDIDFLLKNAASIRGFIPKLKERYASGFFEHILSKDFIDESVSPMKQKNILEAYVNCYYSLERDRAKVLVENFNGLKIQPIGLANKEGKLSIDFGNEIILPTYDTAAADTIFWTTYDKNIEKLLFRIEGEDQLYSTFITPWSKNEELSPFQKLIRAEESNANRLFKLKGDSLILEKGKYTVRNKIYIPEGKVVLIKAGAKVDLLKNAAILSYSKVHIEGTAAEPVHIYSSDQTANGFSVFQANELSTVKHAVFEGLNTLNYEGWNLTGAVNFYESNVKITHTQFIKNQCEDALNIIRSNFTVEDCQFLDIYADAFDSDFCTGVLSNSLFERVGNDAIDFSTSQIEISSCRINQISDKGISGGEESTLTIQDCQISQCNIGIASKDLSFLEVSETTIQDCVYGFVLLKKKTEYGPASIKAKSTETSDCETIHLVEEGSELILNNRKISGSQKNVAALFY